VWVAHEIVDDGEVNLLGSHGCGLGDERRERMRFTKGIIYSEVIAIQRILPNPGLLTITSPLLPTRVYY